MEFVNPHTTKIPKDARELFAKLRPVSHKVTFERTSSTSFLEKKTKEWFVLEKGDISHSFTAQEYVQPEEAHTFNDLTSITRYAYHTAGYQGFFKPSLQEVIQTCADIIRTCDYAYVASEPCNANGEIDYDINHCFNQQLWCHRGKITIWPVSIMPPAK